MSLFTRKRTASRRLFASHFAIWTGAIFLNSAKILNNFRSLTNAEVDAIQEKIRENLVTKLNVSLR